VIVGGDGEPADVDVIVVGDGNDDVAVGEVRIPEMRSPCTAGRGHVHVAVAVHVNDDVNGQGQVTVRRPPPQAPA
jgi:hypothetical protein